MSSASVASSSQRAASSSRSKGAKARTAVTRASGRVEGSALGLDPPRPAPAPRWRGRRPQRLHHEHALLGAGPGQVATVGQRQRAGEVELRESE